MDEERLAELTADLWAGLGYEGCRQLREALRIRMAEHRAVAAAARRDAGLSRPRSTRKPSLAQQAAVLSGGSETGVGRAKAGERYAPHLVPSVMGGTMNLWPAYREAMRIRDAAAMEQALD